jgi:hypothetical protein
MRRRALFLQSEASENHHLKHEEKYLETAFYPHSKVPNSDF